MKQAQEDATNDERPNSVSQHRGVWQKRLHKFTPHELHERQGAVENSDGPTLSAIGQTGGLHGYGVEQRRAEQMTRNSTDTRQSSQHIVERQVSRNKGIKCMSGGSVRVEYCPVQQASVWGWNFSTKYT